MRIRIRLQTETQQIKVPFNYNTILTGIIYTTLHDQGYSNYLHTSKGFKYWSISQMYFHNYHIDKVNNCFHVDGGFTFIVSCPDTYFITSLMEGLLEREHISVNGQRLLVDEVLVLDHPQLSVSTEYYTLSPICVRTKREVDGKLKQYDLNPSEQQFYDNIGKLICKKYNQYHDQEKYTSDDVHVTSKMMHIKGVRVAIRKGKYTIYNRAYFMDIRVTAPLELQEFLYDCGLGEKTAMGFGCITV